MTLPATIKAPIPAKPVTRAFGTYDKIVSRTILTIGNEIGRIGGGNFLAVKTGSLRGERNVENHWKV